MAHICSPDDRSFQKQVEACDFPATRFDHRSHLRLAYIYLVDSDVETAIERMRSALIRLLEHAGVDPAEKFHETLTQAWVLAVFHFMKQTENCESSNGFIDRNPDMLDSRIMMTHYSEEVLFSKKARRGFVDPNLDLIPRYDGNIA